MDKSYLVSHGKFSKNQDFPLQNGQKMIEFI